MSLSLTCLNNDIYGQLYSYLDDDDLLSLGFVCKIFSIIFSDEKLWEERSQLKYPFFDKSTHSWKSHCLNVNWCLKRSYVKAYSNHLISLENGIIKSIRFLQYQHYKGSIITSRISAFDLCSSLRLITGSYDGTVKIFHRSNNEALTIKCQKTLITALKFYENGFFACHSNHTIDYWTFELTKGTYSLKGTVLTTHKKAITVLDFVGKTNSPESICSGSADGTICLHNFPSNQQQFEQKDYVEAFPSAVSTICTIIKGYDYVLAGSINSESVKIFKIVNKHFQVYASFYAHQKGIISIKNFSNECFLTIGRDHYFKTWNIHAHTPTTSVKLSHNPKYITSSDEKINNVAIVEKRSENADFQNEWMMEHFLVTY